MVIPRTRSSSKHTWVSFYNEEAEDTLMTYLGNRREGRLFPWDSFQYRKMWSQLKEETERLLTPKILRMWFCSEMATLGVPDRYIDAFCGRLPKTVLARHYTDYSPKRLKQIYDKANLRILS